MVRPLRLNYQGGTNPMTYKLSILVIEDEKNICNFIETTLQTQNYKVFTSHSASEGLSLIASQCPDLILLDLGLPDLDGIEVIRQIRTWSNIPIIVISARNIEKEKVEALDLGADDYITKPFGTAELLARLRTAFRHSHPKHLLTQATHTFCNGTLQIDFNKRRILIDNQEVHLTQIEYKIVSLLAKNAGKVMTYDAIMTNIWGPYADTNNRILRVNMANIRRKIERNPAEPRYIFTEIGVGYRMIEEDANEDNQKTP